MRNVPPSAISQTVATNGLRGSVSRFERNEPVDQEMVDAIITASPSAVDPAPRPGATTRSEPEEAGEGAEARRPRGVLGGERAGAR